MAGESLSRRRPTSSTRSWRRCTGDGSSLGVGSSLRSARSRRHSLVVRPAALVLSLILAVPVLSHEAASLPDRTSSVGAVASDVRQDSRVPLVPTVPPTAEPTRRPEPVRAVIPEPPRATEPDSHRTSVTVRGTSSWYCGHGSPCTRGYPDGLYAAAGPALRVGDWRGRRVLVSANGRSVWVRLIDTCQCYGTRVIDAYAKVWAALGVPISRGIVKVSVTW